MPWYPCCARTATAGASCPVKHPLPRRWPYGLRIITTGSLPPVVGLYLSVESSVPSRIGTWMVSQTTPGKLGLVTGAADVLEAASVATAANAARWRLESMDVTPSNATGERAAIPRLSEVAAR